MLVPAGNRCVSTCDSKNGAFCPEITLFKAEPTALAELRRSGHRKVDGWTVFHLRLKKGWDCLFGNAWQDIAKKT